MVVCGVEDELEDEIFPPCRIRWGFTNAESLRVDWDDKSVVLTCREGLQFAK